MQFSKLAKYFEKLEKTASRLEMTRILAKLFKESGAEEIKQVCYLCLGRLVPLYKSLEFNLAEKMVIRAIAQAFGVESKGVTSEFKKRGDLGEVFQELRIKNQESRINGNLSLFKKEELKDKSVLGVYKALKEVAKEEGQGSQDRKVRGLVGIINSLDGLSVRYVVRLVAGKLRLGFSDKTMIDGLSWMLKGDKSLRERIEAGYFLKADIGEIAKSIKSVKSIKGIKSIKPELGIPIMPALCQRLKTADEMIAKMGKVACEPKWDGLRVCVHIKGKDFVKAFTRSLEDATHMFPELKGVYEQIKAKSVILDTEAVGVNPKTGKLLSFQDTIIRKRKHGVEAASRAVPLKFFVFDVLYKDGESLINEPLYKRRKILESIVRPGKVLEAADQIVTEDIQRLRKYHKKQLSRGLEGVVIKKYDDKYIPGRRGWSWVKFKEEETAEGGLRDTLDLVVMGYYRGKGKRAGFGIGAFLVGIKQGEKFLTVAKIGTGLSDEQWRQMRAKSKWHRAKSRPKEYIVHKGLECDVWVSPSLVVEIAADNITRSPTHSAGLALRFPRLVRFRDDKKVEQIISLKELKQLA